MLHCCLSDLSFFRKRLPRATTRTQRQIPTRSWLRLNQHSQVFFFTTMSTNLDLMLAGEAPANNHGTCKTIFVDSCDADAGIILAICLAPLILMVVLICCAGPCGHECCRPCSRERDHPAQRQPALALNAPPVRHAAELRYAVEVQVVPHIADHLPEEPSTPVAIATPMSRDSVPSSKTESDIAVDLVPYSSGPGHTAKVDDGVADAPA